MSRITRESQRKEEENNPSNNNPDGFSWIKEEDFFDDIYRRGSCGFEVEWPAEERFTYKYCPICGLKLK